MARGVWDIGYGNCGGRGLPECPTGTGFSVLSIFVMGISTLVYLLFKVSPSGRGPMTHLLAFPVISIVVWIRVVYTGVRHFHGDVNIVFFMVISTLAAFVFGYFLFFKGIVGGPERRFELLRAFRFEDRRGVRPLTASERRVFGVIVLLDLLSVPAGVVAFGLPFS